MDEDWPEAEGCALDLAAMPAEHLPWWVLFASVLELDLHGLARARLLAELAADYRALFPR